MHLPVSDTGICGLDVLHALLLRRLQWPTSNQTGTTGKPNQEPWEQVNLGGVSGAGGVHEALMFPGCVNIHPLSYVNGLADAVVKHGGHVFENSLVTDFSGKKVCTDIANR